MKQLLFEDYCIVIGRNVSEELNSFLFQNYSSEKKYILVDENTNKNCLILLKKIEQFRKASVIKIESGEKNKNINTVIKVWKQLFFYKADRKSLLINLGGGVISDLGGFTASTFKRGISFINVPTTLLAQVDASIGGKTGIDFIINGTTLKNQIGVFRHPKAVFVFPAFLKTLNKREILSGFAEIIKHALIRDRIFWRQLKELPSPLNLPKQTILEKIIIRSIEIKREIVLKDPQEVGLRKILNFGHTIGHAIESISLKKDKKFLLHGEAIAIGMLCEAYISTKVSGLNKNEFAEIVFFINRFYPSYHIKKEFFSEILELMRSDKKNEYNAINFSLLSKIGHCKINQNCSDLLILESLRFYNSLS